jgi:Ca2+/Na+ antiporter
LATSIEATRQGHLDLAFGDIIGSGFINITLILGVTLVAAQFTLNS